MTDELTRRARQLAAERQRPSPDVEPPTVEQLIRQCVHVLATAMLDPWEIDAARIDYAGGPQ